MCMIFIFKLESIGSKVVCGGLNREITKIKLRRYLNFQSKTRLTALLRKTSFDNTIASRRVQILETRDFELSRHLTSALN